jgi:hypothetical protein
LPHLPENKDHIPYKYCRYGSKLLHFNAFRLAIQRFGLTIEKSPYHKERETGLWEVTGSSHKRFEGSKSVAQTFQNISCFF